MRGPRCGQFLPLHPTGPGFSSGGAESREVVRVPPACSPPQKRDGTSPTTTRSHVHCLSLSINSCTPIYLGAADIAAFIPTPSAVIDYRALGGTPEALAAELARLNASPAAYEAHHAWRALPPSAWSPAFRRLVARGAMEHTQCQICRRAAMHRAQWKGKNGGGSGAPVAPATGAPVVRVATADAVAAAAKAADAAPAEAVQK